MSRKKKPKKQRSMFISIGIEAGSDLEFLWDHEAQVLSYRVKKEGKTVKPVNTTIGLSYDRPDRPDKGPKVIAMSSSPTLPPILNFDEMLSKYTYVVSVDTSYANDGEDTVCATCMFFTDVIEAPSGPVAIWKSVYGLVFWNPPVGKAESFAWKKAVQLIQHFKSYTEEQRYLLLVDPHSRDIPEYNLHRLPLIDDYYLPKNFEMFYASSDLKNDTLANYLFFIADNESKKLRDLVSPYKPSDMDLETASAEEEGRTFWGIVKPVVEMQEIDGNAKMGKTWQTYLLDFPPTAPATRCILMVFSEAEPHLPDLPFIGPAKGCTYAINWLQQVAAEKEAPSH